MALACRTVLERNQEKNREEDEPGATGGGAAAVGSDRDVLFSGLVGFAMIQMRLVQFTTRLLKLR
jgi:hypothetical protein